MEQGAFTETVFVPFTVHRAGVLYAPVPLLLSLAFELVFQLLLSDVFVCFFFLVVGVVAVVPWGSGIACTCDEWSSCELVLLYNHRQPHSSININSWSSKKEGERALTGACSMHRGSSRSAFYPLLRLVLCPTSMSASCRMQPDAVRAPMYIFFFFAKQKNCHPGFASRVLETCEQT